MAVKIGSAHIDERGQAKGGKAGDQTGNELGLQNWYRHSKGWVVLRPKSREKGQLIAQDMVWACANPHIGYDQGQRLTLYNAAKPYGFNCKLVTENCETDCSALVRVCLAYAGIMVGNFTTANEASALVNSGYFDKLTASKYTTKPDYLRAGDVLVTKTQGHTVIVTNDGPLAEMDEPEDPVVPANPVAPDGTYYRRTRGTYWLREKPSLTGARIMAVQSGTRVLVYGYIGNWYGIKTPAGRKGYISRKAIPAWEVVV